MHAAEDGETCAATADTRAEDVNRVLREARACLIDDPGCAKAFAQRAFEMSCDTEGDDGQYSRGLAGALGVLAEVSLRGDDYSAAAGEAEQALRLIDEEQPCELLVRLLLTRHKARFFLGDYVDSIDDATRAAELAGVMNHPELSTLASIGIADVLTMTEGPAAAIDRYERALVAVRLLGDEAVECRILNNMAYAYMGQNEREAAITSAQAALEIAPASDIDLESGVIDTLAEVLLEYGQFEEALAYSVAGLNSLRSRQFAEDARMLTNYGRALLGCGQGPAALEAAEEALLVAERHQRAMDIIGAHKLLTQIQEERGDVISALLHHKLYHDAECARLRQVADGRLAAIQVTHQVEAARKDAEIHRLRGLALEREIEEYRSAQAELEVQASLDALTGLPNRRHVPVIERLMSLQLQHLNRPCSLLLLDVDNFKGLNDELGHQAGDAALLSIAQHLSQVARDDDTPLRYGGDEFMVFLAGADAEAARAVAERLRLSIASSLVRHHERAFSVTVSIGVAEATADAPLTLTELIEQADRALYAAKRGGRNQVASEPN